jgi:hypothetical protein
MRIRVGLSAPFENASATPASESANFKIAAVLFAAIESLIVLMLRVPAKISSRYCDNFFAPETLQSHPLRHFYSFTRCTVKELKETLRKLRDHAGTDHLAVGR